MSSLNKATLIGRVGKDPQILRTQAGKKTASFSLATSEYWKDKNTSEKRDKTEWHNIVIYNENIAKVVESYVNKGSLICVEGQLQTRKWQDKDGKDRYTTEIVLQNFDGKLILLGGKSDNSLSDDSGQYKPLPQASNSYNAVDLDDDLPF